jgi:flap endonuclease-1
MGIKNLKSLLKKFSPNSLKYIKLDKFKNNIIAVDTSIYLYKYKYNNNFIDSFIRQILRLLKNKILPLYIFDGKPPQEKKQILDSRYNRKENLKKKKESLEKIIDTIKNSDDLSIEIIDDLKKQHSKITKKIINITKEDIYILKNVLTYMGVPYINAPGEAEIFCSYLSNNNIINGCISEDTDVIASGIKYFIRGININKNYAYVYNLDDILNDLRLNYTEFVDLCLLCGCDYLPRIEGIGYISSYNLITKYRTIENILESNLGTKFNKKFKEKYNTARKLINNTDINYSNNILIKFNKPNVKKLLNYLLKVNHNNLKTIRNLHYNLNNYYNNIKHIEINM